MKIRASYIAVVLIAAPIGLSMPQISAQSEAKDPVREYAREQAEDRAMDRVRLREMRRDSQIAIDRVSIGCVPVSPINHPTAGQLGEGGESIDLETGNPIPDGHFVCTGAGSTAEMQNGVTVNVANVSPEDRAEYFRLFDLQREVR